jgi:dodecin
MTATADPRVTTVNGSRTAAWKPRVGDGLCLARLAADRTPGVPPRRSVPLVAERVAPVGTVQTSEPGFGEEDRMSVYRVTEVIGTSAESWEDAASVATRTASQTIRDLRVAEVVAQDIHLAEDGGITYRTKLNISFKYESGEQASTGA